MLFYHVWYGVKPLSFYYYLKIESLKYNVILLHKLNQMQSSRFECGCKIFHFVGQDIMYNSIVQYNIMKKKPVTSTEAKSEQKCQITQIGPINLPQINWLGSQYIDLKEIEILVAASFFIQNNQNTHHNTITMTMTMTIEKHTHVHTHWLLLVCYWLFLDQFIHAAMNHYH